MLEAFEHYFGPHPFPKDGFKLIEVPYTGMEHQTTWQTPRWAGPTDTFKVVTDLVYVTVKAQGR